jgi:hypothetical protein
MRQRVWWLALGAVLAGCSEQKPAPKRIVPVAVKVSDEGRRFPSKDQVKIEVVNQKLLGKEFLPGGNLAEYKVRGKTYQQFLVRAETPDKAAFLLLDFKNVLTDAKFVPHMGAFYGRDGDKPVYVLQKGVWLGGYVGLTDKEAEPLAREFAARLN